ncbi:hypothetical protein MHI37_06855 [Paenibacillus sp. FSL H8-0548]|nr:hypothetical protein [Paenibacillus sp. FSL H8-0548]
MKLEDDPTVKTQPSKRMRKNLSALIVKDAQKRAAKANQGA